MPTTWNAIYLGSIATATDPSNGNDMTDAAGGAALVGRSFGCASAPLYERVVSIQSSDLSGLPDKSDFPALNQNSSSVADQVITDLNGDGTTETYHFDTVAAYSATLTYFDGSAATVPVAIFQTTNGQLFLGPSLSAVSNAALTEHAILSMRLDRLLGPTCQGLIVDRPRIEHVCFAAGTRIATPTGDRRVETLAVGDLVLTADAGPQPIRWVGMALVDLRDAPQMRPVRIRANALGPRQPLFDLTVSPQHRVMVRSAIARRLFGADEGLVAARQLLALDGVEAANDLDRVLYVHFLFDRHQIIFSNGAPTESLLTGPEALTSVGEIAGAEVLPLFPDATDRGAASFQNRIPVRRARRVIADCGRSADQLPVRPASARRSPLLCRC